MIEERNWIRVGRDEIPTEDTRVLFDIFARIRDRAYASWLFRYPDEYKRWTSWHTIGFVGTFGKWHTVDFETWSGFGRDLVPVLQHRLRYDPFIDKIDPVPPPLDPPLLHHSSRFLSAATIIRLFGMDEKRAKGSYDKLLNAESILQRMSLLNPPHFQNRSVWTKALSQQGIRIEGALPHTITVKQGDASVSAWDVDPGLAEDQTAMHRRIA
jgi:hypothetical protein